MKKVGTGHRTAIMICGGLLLTAMVLSALTACGHLQEGSPRAPVAGVPLQVLFLGSGATYINDLPGQVAALAAAGRPGRKIAAEEITFHGAGLAHHLSREYSWSLAAIETGRFDFVVIQGRNQEVLEDPELFLEQAQTLAAAVRTGGGTPVFVETWTWDPGSAQIRRLKLYDQAWSGGNPRAMQARLRRVFHDLEAACGALLAPAGDAWEHVLEEQPQLALHDEYGSAPTVCGTYLSACVIAAVLTGADPRQADWRPAGVTRKEARLLRAAAWEVLESQ